MGRAKLRSCLVLLFLIPAVLVAQPLPNHEHPDPALAPLPIRGEFLLNNGFLALTASSTDLVEPKHWSFELRYSSENTFAKSVTISRELIRRGSPEFWDREALRQRDEDLFVIDGESQRVTLSLRHGLSSRLEVRADLPILSMNKAWADELIENFHTELHLGSDGRSAIARDGQFIYLKTGSREIYRDRPIGPALGDVMLGAKYLLPAYRGAELAAELLVELPTGNADDLVGSGSVDAGVNLLASRILGRSIVHAASGATPLGRATDCSNSSPSGSSPRPSATRVL